MADTRQLPNILLIVLDTARADAFEPYGAGSGATPTVAELATDGFAYPAAYAPSSWTVPSHISMLSGLMPRSAGLHTIPQQSGHFRKVMRGLKPRLLPDTLRRAGYRSVGISANAWVSEASGFDTGFDTFHNVIHERHNRLGSTRARTKLHWVLDGLKANLDDGAAEIRRLLEETGKGSTPFFCFVNLVECHSPYLPPKPFNDLGWMERLRSVRDANRFCTFESFWKVCLEAEPLPPNESLERMRRLYHRSIAQLDSWLSDVLEDLQTCGLLVDTQVIVTSDHGENFGEGGLIGHCFSLDDRLIRVPLVTAGPLRLPERRSVSLADLPSIIGNALSLDHPWGPPRPDDGIALAQLPAPAQPDDPVAHQGAEAWSLPPQGVRRMFRASDCATDGSLKLTRNDLGDQLVLLASDPLELRPVSVDAELETAYGERLANLRRTLDEADSCAADAAPGVRTGGENLAVSDKEADHLERQMRILGYL